MYELIVLSLLISGRAHGYSIIKIMNDIAGPYTKFSHGRLYPLLVRLEKEGSIVTVDDVSGEQAGGRHLHSYEITEEGRERFHEVMMNITSSVGDYQKLFLHKVQAMEHLEPAERLILLEHYINFCQAHVLYMIAKVEEVLRLQTHGISPSRNNALVKIMRHIADQWQLELEWANELLEEERAQLK
jgi:DNA-binding PadR family transcriptional regulator